MPPLDLADYAFTPLHLAILGLSSNTVTKLLAQSLSFTTNVGDSFDHTALWWAARRDNYNAIELLLHNLADPDKPNVDEIRPIISAIIAQSDRCLRLLLKYGININQADFYKYTPLLHLSFRHNSLNLLNLLLRFHPELDIQVATGDSTLLIALEFQQYDITTRLIQVGANIHIKKNAGYNTLTIAILFNAHTLIQILLDRQADHHGPIRPHRSLLHLITEAADINTLRILTRSTLTMRNVQDKRNNR